VTLKAWVGDDEATSKKFSTEKQQTSVRNRCRVICLKETNHKSKTKPKYPSHYSTSVTFVKSSFLVYSFSKQECIFSDNQPCKYGIKQCFEECSCLQKPPHPNWLWGPPSILSNAYTKAFSLGGEAARAWSWPLTSI